MAKKISKFKDVVAKMAEHKTQSILELTKTMDITRRRYNQCLNSGQIPYKGVMNWCLAMNVSLDEILLEEI